MGYWPLVICCFFVSSLSIPIVEPPFIRSGVSADGTQIEQNETVRVSTTGVPNPFGTKIVLQLDTPLNHKVGLEITFWPTQYILEFYKERWIPEDVAVMKYERCDGSGQTEINANAETIIPNDLVTTNNNNTNDTETKVFNAYLDSIDPDLLANAYTTLAPTLSNDTDISSYTNIGRTLLQLSVPSEDDPGCTLASTKFPCDDVCVMKIDESQSQCKQLVKSVYDSMAPNYPLLYTPTSLPGSPALPLSFDAYMDNFFSVHLNMQIVNKEGYAHNIPSAYCTVPGYDVDAYIANQATYVFPDTEAADCIPLGFDLNPTQEDCENLGKASTSDDLTECMGSTLLELSQEYEDDELLKGTGVTRVFQAYLRNALVNISDSCGLNTKTGKGTISVAQLSTDDYFESVTPCACSLHQYSELHRTCVTNPWNITSKKGIIPIMPQVQKCRLGRGTWFCSAFTPSEGLRILGGNKKKGFCDGDPPRGDCAAALNEGRDDPSCDETVNVLFRQQWTTQDPNLRSQFNISVDNLIQNVDFNSRYLTTAKEWSTSLWTEQGWDGFSCGLEDLGGLVGIGDGCDCNHYVVQYRDDSYIAFQQATDSQDLITQGMTLTAALSGLTNLTAAFNIQTQVGFALLRTNGQTQSAELENLRATMNLAKTLASGATDMSSQSQQLELIARKWSETILSRYGTQQTRLDNLQTQLNAIRGGLGEEAESLEKLISVMRVSLEHKKRTLEQIQQLNAASRLAQKGFQSAMTQQITQRIKGRQLIKGTTQHMRRTKADTFLNPFVSFGADASGNYGIPSRGLLSHEKIMSVDLQHVWYLAPSYLQHVPQDNALLIELIQAVVSQMMNPNASDNVMDDLFLTSPEQDLVSQYLNTSLYTTNVHQLSMQLQCNTMNLMNFDEFEVDMDTLRDWIGPDGCTLGSHGMTKQCKCRVRLIHRVCVHGNTPHHAATILQTPSFPRNLALDSSAVNHTGLCVPGSGYVRVPIWNRNGPVQTDPIDTGILSEMDRFWLDVCKGVGNTPSLFASQMDQNLTLDDVLQEEESEGLFNASENTLATNLPCAISINSSLFSNDTSDPCLGVTQRLNLQQRLDPLSVGSKLEVSLPIFNHTVMGGFLVFADGMGRISSGNNTVVFDPTRCSSNKVLSELFMHDRADGKMLLYYFVQRLAADAMLAVIASPLLKNLEYITTGMIPIGTRLFYTMIGNPNDPTQLPANPSVYPASPSVSMVTGVKETNPDNALYDLERVKQIASSDRPYLLTPQGEEQLTVRQPTQWRECVGASYLATGNVSLPVRYAKLVKVDKKVSVRVVSIDGNSTLSNQTVATQITSLGLKDFDFVDRSIWSSVGSEAATLLANPNQRLYLVGLVSSMLGLPVDYQLSNSTSAAQYLHPKVPHQSGGVPLPPPIPTRNPVIAVNDTSFATTSLNRRSPYIYDPPSGILQSLNTPNEQGSLGYVSLLWPDEDTDLGGGADGLSPVRVPRVARAEDMNAYALPPMFAAEDYFEQRGFDFSQPSSKYEGYNPEGGIVNPHSFLTLLRESKRRNPQNSSQVARILECASKPETEFGTWCNILEKFRVVDPLQEDWRPASDRPSNVDPNPDRRPQLILEAYGDSDNEIVTMSFPKGVLAKLVLDSQPCPSSISLVNAFRDNTTIELSRPLEAGLMHFRLDIDSLDMEDSCHGSQNITIQGYTSTVVTEPLLSPTVSIPLYDCRPQRINLTRLDAGSTRTTVIPCWQYSSDASDLSLNPGTDNLNVVVEEDRNSRILSIQALNQLLFSPIAGKFTDLVIGSFLDNTEFHEQVTNGNIYFPSNGSQWLPLNRLPGVNESVQAFFNGTDLETTNYSYAVETRGSSFYNNNGFNVSEFGIEMESIYNQTRSNSSSLLDMIDAVTNRTSQLRTELERRMEKFQGISDIIDRIGNLSITSSELSSALSDLLDQAHALMFNFADTIAILMNQAFDFVTPKSWYCYLIMGNSEITDNPVAAAGFEEAQKEDVRIKKEIFDSYAHDCEGFVNFVCGDLSPLRSFVWITVVVVIIMSILCGSFLFLINPGLCGPCTGIRNTFGRTPPRNPPAQKAPEQKTARRISDSDIHPSATTTTTDVEKRAASSSTRNSRHIEY